jgi:hypothetical protein
MSIEFNFSFGSKKKFRVYDTSGQTSKFIYFNKEDEDELLKYLHLTNKKIDQICAVDPIDGMWHPGCIILETRSHSGRTNKEILDTFFSKL